MRKQHIVVQPYGGNAQRMEPLNEGFADFSLNNVISAVEGSGGYDATMPDLRVLARINRFSVGLYVAEKILRGKSIIKGGSHHAFGH